MKITTGAIMSSRALPRFSPPSRTFIRSPLRRHFNRRFQSTEAPTSSPAQGLFQRLWNSPVGVKTVHFWAPVMKWAIVVAGISDLSRPVENLSLTQNLALTATGAIWTRWCFIIKPRNILLATVNFFLGCVGVMQVTRILTYRRGLKGETKDIKETAKGVVEDVGAKVEKVIK